MRPIDHLYRGCRLDPSAIAVEDGTRSMTYRDLVRATDAIASGLQREFPEPGARIGVCAFNTIEHMLAVLAVYAADHVWVALNPRNGRQQLDSMIGRAGLDAVIADTDCLDRFSADCCPVILGAGASGSDGPLTLAGLQAAFERERPKVGTTEPARTQAIKFTGGSTGEPKGVLQSRRCINASIESFLHAFRFDATDVNLCAAPLTHGSSHYILPILATGGRHILVNDTKAPALLDAIEERGITTSFMPPTMIYNLMAEDGIEQRDFASLRHLQYGAAAMPEAQIRRARAVFNNAIEVIYGQTEAPMMITAMTAAEFDDARNLTSVGRQTLHSRVAVRNEDGTAAQPGEQGEIVVAGDLLMTGYLDQPEETARTIVGGWLHTGDAGVLDERGYLFIKDRLRDIVITGGFNVYPTEVEQALAACPQVSECIVFGVPDEKWGERLEAAVVLEAGSAMSVDDIRGYVRERLGPVQTPKKLHLVDALPRNAVGKVMRREMRQRFGTSGDNASPSSEHSVRTD